MLKQMTILIVLIAGAAPALATDIGFDISSDVASKSLDVFDRTTNVEMNDATPRYCPATNISISRLADTGFEKEVQNQLLNSYNEAQQKIRETMSVRSLGR